MATAIYEQELTLEDVLELSADELREELTGREIDAKGMSKVEMQKAFIKILFPVAPEVMLPVEPRTALSSQQQMELEVMKLKMESEEREKRLRFESEALERKRGLKQRNVE